MMCRLFWRFVLLGVLSTISPSCPLTINTGKSPYYAATGSVAQLTCKFSSNSKSHPDSEVIWVIMSKDQEQPIIWFNRGVLYADMYKPMKGRVRFISSNPQKGDGSIIIEDVRLSDTETYYCFVKIMPEYGRGSVTLVVIEPHSDPLCRMYEEDNGMRLECTSPHPSIEGLKYTWSKTDGNQVLTYQGIAGPTGSTLHLTNVTHGECGSYRCTVESIVSTKHCVLALSCPLLQDQNCHSPQLLTTSAMASIITTVSTIVIVPIVVGVVIYCRRKLQLRDISLSFVT
ncbi:coxsackievirus and adenovirus receptor homolog isoform X2 [Stigmatopora nigra]